MWFKQAHLLQMSAPIDAALLEKSLQDGEFTPCLASLPASYGWASPFNNDDAPLVHAANGYILICLQIEEKVLPASVIRKQLADKVKAIEAQQDKKLSAKQKRLLKEELTFSLLPQAFTKLDKVYAYIDTHNQWVIVDTVQKAKLEKFNELFKRCLPEHRLQPLNIKKMAPILSHWLLHDDQPQAFTIDKSCLLQDPNNTSRSIRCQQQELQVQPIRSLLMDNCQAVQIGINWQDKLQFVLADDFTLRSIRYQDELLSLAKEQYSESPEQQLDAEFFIMTESLTGLLQQLVEVFADTNKLSEPEAVMA